MVSVTKGDEEEGMQEQMEKGDSETNSFVVCEHLPFEDTPCAGSDFRMHMNSQGYGSHLCVGKRKDRVAVRCQPRLYRISHGLSIR